MSFQSLWREKIRIVRRGGAEGRRVERESSKISFVVDSVVTPVTRPDARCLRPFVAELFDEMNFGADLQLREAGLERALFVEIQLAFGVGFQKP
jgi:hypothetical protein